jgi:hypothetical protein
MLGLLNRRPAAWITHFDRFIIIFWIKNKKRPTVNNIVVRHIIFYFLNDRLLLSFRMALKVA